MIVIATQTILDGTVVRWYLSEGAERPAVTASHNGVRVEAWLHDVPEGLLDQARDVWRELARDNNADMSHLATHRRRIGGELVPIERAEVSG